MSDPRPDRLHVSPRMTNSPHLSLRGRLNPGRGVLAALFALWAAVFPIQPGARALQSQPPAAGARNVSIRPSQTEINATLPPDPEVDKIVREYGEGLKKQMGEVIGAAGENLVKGLGGGSLGAFVADVIRARATQLVGAPIDVALLNSGGMRRDIRKGEVRVGTVFELMPFENEIVIFELKGDRLLSAFKHLAARSSADSSDAIAGAEIILCNSQLATATVNGGPIDLQKRYRIATVDFLAEGGSGYEMFRERSNYVPTGLPLRQALIETFKQAKERGQVISPDNLGRVRVRCPPGPMRSSSLKPRIAIIEIDYKGTSAMVTLTAAVSEAIRGNGFDLLEPGMVESALTGINRRSLLNLTVEEAARLGSLIGAEYCLLVSGEIRDTRSDSDDLFRSGWATIFLVNGVTGQLVSSTFSRQAGAADAVVSKRLAADLRSGLDKSLQQAGLAKRPFDGNPSGMDDGQPPGISDLLDETSHFAPPEIIGRMKPVYTQQADAAGIDATVELEAEFRMDGRVGQIRIIRWAGFGLDQAAIEAARQLRFRPALLKGIPTGSWQRLVYNFRRREG